MNITSLYITNRSTINKYITIINIIKFHKQINHCRFTCSSRTNNSNLLTSFNLCCKIIYNNLIIIITKFNIFKFNITLTFVPFPFQSLTMASHIFYAMSVF